MTAAPNPPAPAIGEWARRTWRVLALPLVSIVLALIVGGVIILVSQLIVPDQEFDWTLPITAYSALFQGAFGSFDAIVNTLVFTTPLVLTGLAVGLAFKGGLFNIGAAGQFLMGALAAVAVGVAVKSQPAFVAFPVALLAGLLGGAFWGFIPGILKAVSGAHEVVTTIMLNYIAVAVLAAVVSGPLDQPGSPSPITDDVGNAAFPFIIGSNGHIGILVAIAAVFIVGFLLDRTTLGFEIRTVGANPDAARYAGMRPRWLIVLTMTLAGMLAGAAGAGQILGVNHVMTASYGSAATIGFTAIAVALLASANPYGIFFAALLFGAMRAGAGLMQIQAGVPPELIDVLQATILLFLVSGPVLRRVFRLRGAKTGLDAADTIARSYASEGAP
jgi:general nucleoside transport system permease protein